MLDVVSCHLFTVFSRGVLTIIIAQWNYQYQVPALQFSSDPSPHPSHLPEKQNRTDFLTPALYNVIHTYSIMCHPSDFHLLLVISGTYGTNLSVLMLPLPILGEFLQLICTQTSIVCWLLHRILDIFTFIFIVDIFLP